MQDLPLEMLNQPFGTQFNPLQILQTLNFKSLNASDLYTIDDLFVHPDYHSQFFAETEHELLEQITLKQQETETFLVQADTILLTFGTAYYYQDNVLKRPVANCHKQPSHRFTKRINNVSEITKAYAAFLEKWPNIHLILTLSPVRHTRDGMMENCVSKATLRLAANEIAHAYPQQISYFPAYEIMMDELRDYRFYEKDLIHPNEIAVDYIWGKFKETYFSLELSDIEMAWQRVLKTLAHRPHLTKINAQINTLIKLKEEISNPVFGVNYSKLLQKLNVEILSLKASLEA